MLALLMLSARPAMAQSSTVPLDSLPQRGVVPAGTYAPTNVDTVDAVSGNVLVKIPLAKLPPGRAGWSAGLGLIYNSNIYDVISAYGLNPVNSAVTSLEQTLTPSSSGGGWQYSYNYQIWLEFRPQQANPVSDPNTPGYSDYCYNHFENTYLYKLSVIFPDGSHHTMHMYGQKDADDYYPWDPAGQGGDCIKLYTAYLLGIQPAPTGNVTYYSIDGTFFNLTFNLQSSTWTNNPFTLSFPDGRTVTGIGATPMAMSDKNGNTINVQNLIQCSNVCSPPATVLSDAFGRSITVQSNLNNQDVITQTWFPASPADPAPGNTGTLTWTVNWETVSVTGAHIYPCWPGANGQPLLNCDANGLAQRVVQSISLPQPPDGSNLQYQFSYNGSTGWGQMSDLTLPSLAAVHYDFYAFGLQGYGFLLNAPVQDKTETWLDENDSPATMRQEKWAYQFTPFYSLIANPDGGVTETDYFTTVGNPPGVWQGGLTWRILYPDGSMTQKVWTQNVPYDPGTVERTSARNPFVRLEFDTLPNGTQTKAKSYSYDASGNQVAVAEYDWFPYSQVLQSNGLATDFTSTPPSPVRQTADTYMYQTATAVPGANSTNDDPNAYWHSAAPVLRDLLLRSVVTGAGLGSVSEYGYDSRGNPTQKRLWDSSLAASPPASLNAGNALVMNTNYDQYGNVTDVFDAKGNQTHYDYDGNSLYLVDKVKANGTYLAETTTYRFEPNTGVMTQVVDPNQLTTAFGYDRYARLVTSTESSGGVTQRLTTNLYEDLNRRIAVKADLNSAGDQALQSVTDYDQLGRVRLSRQLECSTAVVTLLNCAAQSIDDDTTGIKVETRYQSVQAANGYSAKLVSNPFRGGTAAAPPSEATMGWTLSKSDQMGRVVSVTSYSGATLPSPWNGGNNASTGAVTTTYNQDTTASTGTVTTTTNQDTVRTTDQAQHARISTSDALGRLVTVTEDPGGMGYVTQYSYDALDSLTGVTQGSLSRSFSYDSLKRLTQAQNPESGTINYSYRSGGALCSGDASAVCSHTDARSYTTTMTYDALNRLTAKSYSDGSTPKVDEFEKQALAKEAAENVVLSTIVRHVSEIC
jgi:YD repeat-containing protein